ncbi:GIN domain-containing protein [Sphingomonas sp. RS2018]
MIRHLLLFALAASAAVPAAAEERRFMFAGFDRIRVEGPFEVTVVRGSPDVVAVGDTLALDRVSVRADGRTLVVTAGINGWGGFPGDAKPAPVVRISAAELRSIVVLGGGRVTVDRLSGQRVDAAVSGAGSLSVADVRADRFEGGVIGNGTLTLTGRALGARFQLSGGGSVDATALSATALTVLTQGTATGRFTATATADITADGQGSVDVAGTPACKVRGTAVIRCGAR